MNKTIRIAFCFILGVAVAFAETLSPGQLEQQLKELSRAPVDYAAAGKWFNLAKALSSDGQRQEALMAAAAALIYVGKGDVYQKNIKTQIDDVSTFEGQFLGDCPDCRGGGESERPCPACKGSGRCQYANCQGGRHRIHQINGDKNEPCRECKGSGQCQKCKGRGNLEEKCARCGGRGKSMDKELVLAAYKAHAGNALRFAQEERERKEREQRDAEEKERIEAGRLALNTTEKSVSEKAETASDNPPGDNNDDSPFRTVSEGRKPVVPTRDGYTQGMRYLRYRHRNVASSEQNLKSDSNGKQGGQSDVSQPASIYDSMTIDEIYADALEALHPAKGGKKDVWRAYRGFVEAEKRGYKPAEMAVAHMCWTMTDEEKTQLRDAGVDVPRGWFFVLGMMHAADVLELRLAKCELGLLEIGRGNYSKGINLVQDAADKGLQSARAFLVQLEEQSAKTGKSTDLIAGIIAGNKETLAKFQEMCEIELRTEYLLSLREEGNNGK